MISTKIIVGLVYLVAAPILGGLLSGLDRIITARMQSRVGPPIWQPFYDVGKLFQKENLVVRRSQNVYILFFLIFTIFTGGLFYTGEDLLLIIFSLTLAGIFFVLAGYKGSSPYSFIGAERELIQMMSYEPVLLSVAVGIYLVTKSFFITKILAFQQPLIFLLPGVFLGLVYILTIKLRKSPFDLSTSHHGHQELVKGITTEYSGSALAMIEIAHWYEISYLLGFLYLFFGFAPWLGTIVALSIYFLELVIDNVTARVKWERLLWSSWWAGLLLSFSNIAILYLLKVI